MSFERRLVDTQAQLIADAIKQKIGAILVTSAKLEGELAELETTYSQPIADLIKKIAAADKGMTVPGTAYIPELLGAVVNAAATFALDIHEPKPKMEKEKAGLIEKLDPEITKFLTAISTLEKTVNELELLDATLSKQSDSYDKPTFGKVKEQLQALRKKLGKIITDNALKYANLPNTDLIFDSHAECIDELFMKANQAAIERGKLEEAKIYLTLAQVIFKKIQDKVDPAIAEEFQQRYDILNNRIKLLFTVAHELANISKTIYYYEPIRIINAALSFEDNHKKDSLEYHQQMLELYQGLLNGKKGKKSAFAIAEETVEQRFPALTAIATKLSEQLDANHLPASLVAKMRSENARITKDKAEIAQAKKTALVKMAAHQAEIDRINRHRNMLYSIYAKHAAEFIKLSKKDKIKRTIYNFFGQKTKTEKRADFIKHVLNADMTPFAAGKNVAITDDFKSHVKTAEDKLFSAKKVSKSEKHKLFALALSTARQIAQPGEQPLFQDTSKLKSSK